MTWQKTLKIVVMGGVFSSAVAVMTTRDYVLLAIAVALGILSLIALDRNSPR
jgi:hypothetical protein